MRIVSHRRLVDFYSSEGHGDSKVALERWYSIAEQAEWASLSDIKTDFPATDYVGNQHYVFNIKKSNGKNNKGTIRVCTGKNRGTPADG